MRLASEITDSVFLRWRDRHTDTVRLASTEWLSKSLPAPAVIDVLVPVVSVNSERAAVPPWHTERGVRKGGETHADGDSTTGGAELDFIVDCARLACPAGVVLVNE